MAQPSPAFLAHKFTRENAREMAARGNAARWSRYADAAATAAKGDGIDLDAATSPHARKLERLQAQMDKLDDLLDTAKTAADWRDLTNARTRLFEQWRILSGIPNPGSRRPGREPSRRAAVAIDPQPAGPQETPAA